MRVDKYKGWKHCTNCGVRFPFKIKTKIFCNVNCGSGYRNKLAKMRARPITLPYIPEKLLAVKGAEEHGD